MPSDDSKSTNGACLCGAVRFRVDGPVKQVVACHCRECRRQTTHFMAFTAAWKDQLTIQDTGALRWYRSGERTRRGFCSTCGCVLFFDTDGDDKLSIGAGALDRAPALQLRAHLWMSEKGAYYRLDADAPQHEAGGDEVPMPPRA